MRIQELSEVINWLSEDIFSDPKQRFFVLIDDLDEQFASDPIRLSLIKALILTIKKFRTVRNVRILAAIRTDLLETVFERTRSSGFQEEKFEANANVVSWDTPTLRALIEKRINSLYKSKYTQSNVDFEDLFVATISDQDTFSYLIDRSLKRPRDIIAFVNECLSESVQRSYVSAAAIRKAETSYSAKRFNALRDEWIIQYPLLDLYVAPLQRQPRKFLIAAISDEWLETLMIELISSPNHQKDSLGKLASELGSIDGQNRERFLLAWLQALYSIGIIFLKTQANNEYRSPTTGKQILNQADVDEDTLIYVHPMMWQKFNSITD